MAGPALPEDALFILCCSGYMSKAEQVMMVCLSVANACREQRPWTLKAKPGLPLQLLSWHLLGGDRGEDYSPAALSSDPTAAAATVTPASAMTAAAAAAGPVSRLSPRRLVQRVLVDGSFSLDGVVWPNRVASVEMGEEVVVGGLRQIEAAARQLLAHGFGTKEFCLGHKEGMADVASEACAQIGCSSSSSSSSKPCPLREAAETPMATPAMRAGKATFPERAHDAPAPAPYEALLRRAALRVAFWAGRPTGTCFDRPIREVPFPRTLLHLELLGSFDEPLDGISWPPLETLAFGEMFNQSLAGHGGGCGGLLPPSLKSLTLGAAFDQPLDSVVWPPGLSHLQLGHSFNQDLRGVRWPASLAELYFGDLFRSPIAGVAWPESLRHLEFGHLFRQPLDGVVWPRGLEELRFGGYYNCSLEGEGVELPEGLRLLDLGRSFNQPIEGTRFPDGCRVLTFGDSFDQPVERVKWPKCLQVLRFGSNFNQEIEGASFPDSLTSLTFRQHFDRNIEGVKWPKHLRVLKFGHCFDKPIERVQWPPRLEILVLGHYFNHPIRHLKLPPTLRRIAFSGIFDQPLRRVNWPEKLESVELGQSRPSGEKDVVKWFQRYPDPTGPSPISVDHPILYACMARPFERLAPNLEVADKSLVHREGVVHVHDEGWNPGLHCKALADKLFSLPSFADTCTFAGTCAFGGGGGGGGGSGGGAAGDKVAPEKKGRRRRRGRRGRGAGKGTARGTATTGNRMGEVAVIGVGAPAAVS